MTANLAKTMRSAKFILLLLVLLVVIGICIFWRIGGNHGTVHEQGESPSKQRDKLAVIGREQDAGRRPPVKQSEEQRARHQEFSFHLNEARMHFDSKEIFDTLASLDRADAAIEGRAETLNLRGSCHVEMRQFDKAHDDFKRAAEISKGNPSIQFNIGEVYFVTRRWQEALDVLEDLGKQLPPENMALGRLVEFKILLCKKQLGRNDEVLALAEKYNIEDNSPFPWYAKAALAFEANDPEKAEEWLASAFRRFPNPDNLAPWQDTLVEYGLIEPFEP